MRKKLGVTVFVFSETELENCSFLQAFVCVSIAIPRVHYTKPLQEKKPVPRIVFKDRLMHVSWKWEKNRSHRARFCSTNKTVFYRHWHSCQTSQIRPPQAIRFSSRPLHPMDWTWRSLLNSELWTSSIAIRFWSSRGSHPASSQLGRATLQAIHTTGRFSTAAGTSTIIVANRESSDLHANASQLCSSVGWHRNESLCTISKEKTRRALKILRFFRHFSTTRTYLDDNRERERGPIVSVGVDPTGTFWSRLATFHVYDQITIATRRQTSICPLCESPIKGPGKRSWLAEGRWHMLLERGSMEGWTCVSSFQLKGLQ